MPINRSPRGLGAGHRAGRCPAHLTLDQPLDLTRVAKTDLEKLRLGATRRAAATPQQLSDEESGDQNANDQRTIHCHSAAGFGLRAPGYMLPTGIGLSVTVADRRSAPAAT